MFRHYVAGRSLPSFVATLFLTSGVAAGQQQSFEAAFGDLIAAPPTATPTAETPESAYYQSVLESVKACVAEKKNSAQVCFVNATPRKCESLAYSLPSSRMQWAICVRSCADAGFWSSFLGECRRQR
jgi:hypothetical protein